MHHFSDMKRPFLLAAAVLAAAALAARVIAQAPPPANAVLEAIRREGTEDSQLEPLAQALLDSIGPRLTGSPGAAAAHVWAVAQYRAWGIEARSEKYGTWTGWRRGITHVDLREPRVRSLEGTLLAWSPGTGGPLEGEAVVLPAAASRAEFEAWLATAKGKWVLVSAPQRTCRPPETWERWATPEGLERMRRERADIDAAWARRVAMSGADARWLPVRLEEAGVLGVLSAPRSGGWGAHPVLNAWTLRAPMLGLGCEDYGLVFRLAENRQGPVLRIDAEGKFDGDVDVFNTLAVIPGSEEPEEYVVLSAHLDSWDAASGATDNGAGTVAVMEAMRILKELVPRPKRTIMAGHWSGEEQGLNGSLAFADDHPEVVRGLHALFNLDQGTGRVTRVSMQGLPGAGARFASWFSRVPTDLGGGVEVSAPGVRENGGSDHAAFVCRGAPAFNLESLEWDYRGYTWHTDRDTYDKLVFDDLRANAVLLAMLAYLASEDPEPLPQASEPGPGACRQPARSMVEFLENLLH